MLLSERFLSKAKKGMILPGLHSALLISIGQLCDDECTVVLNNKSLIAIKGDNIVQHLLEEKKEDIILNKARNPNDGLWDITVTKAAISPKIYFPAYISRYRR